MGNRLIYQVSIGNSKLYDFCTKSVAAYCKNHGIDHMVQRDAILRICPDPKTSERSHDSWNKPWMNGPGLPIYEKQNAFQFLKNPYDQVAIVDADIYIREGSPNIFDEFEETNACFAGVVERDMPITDKYRNKIFRYSMNQYGKLSDVNWNWNERFGAEFMNMGLMVMNSCFSEYLCGQTPTEFLRRPEFKRFVDGIGEWKRSTDQTLMNWFIRKNSVPTKHLDWKWNALYRGIKDEYIKDAHFIHFFLKDHLPERGENIRKIRQIVS